MKITLEIDDDELRRVIGPLFQFPAVAAPAATTSLLKTHEAAERLGISRSKFHELVARGQIASISIGRSRRISPTALAEYIARPRGEVVTNGNLPALALVSKTPSESPPTRPGTSASRTSTEVLTRAGTRRAKGSRDARTIDGTED